MYQVICVPFSQNLYHSSRFVPLQHHHFSSNSHRHKQQFPVLASISPSAPILHIFLMDEASFERFGYYSSLNLKQDLICFKRYCEEVKEKLIDLLIAKIAIYYL